MDILKALRAEESKFLGQMEAARQQVETVRAAIKLLGGKPSVNGNRNTSATPRKRMSAEGRARIAAAQRKRWAKIRAQAKKTRAK
jgi:hypothetical protein